MTLDDLELAVQVKLTGYTRIPRAKSESSDLGFVAQRCIRLGDLKRYRSDGAEAFRYRSGTRT